MEVFASTSEMLMTPEQLVKRDRILALLKPVADKWQVAETYAEFEADTELPCCGDQDCINTVAYAFACQGKSTIFDVYDDEDNDRESRIRYCAQCGNPLSHNLASIEVELNALKEYHALMGITKNILIDTQVAFTLYAIFVSLPSYDYDYEEPVVRVQKQQKLLHDAFEFGDMVLDVLSH